MATIQSTLKLNNQMSSTLSSITKAMHSTLSAMKSVKSENSNMSKAFNKAQTDILKAEKSLKTFDNQVKNTSNNMNKGTSSANSFLSSLLGFSAIQKVFNLITGQLDSAIGRFDTMNNFPKVMSNLGISSEESEASINILSERLTGLPTALNDAATSVQRLTSVNGSIGASTEMFLAFNNAILAGGASIEIQSTAIEQLSQAYSKGKMDMMEWRALQTAMPAQLNQVAKAMNMSTDALGEGLRTGKVSMNDFMKTMMKLNKEGVSGFKSFEEQAKNATGGIKTSIANMKTAVTRGITSVMDNINSALEKAGLGTISDIINNFGKSLEKAIKSVGNMIAKIIIFLSPVIKVLKVIVQFIKDNWSIIGPIFNAILAILLVYIAYLGMVKVATMVWNAAQAVLNATLWANPIGMIILAIIALIAIIYVVVGVINKVTGESISALGVIVGALYTAVAFIWNLFLGFLDLTLGIINYFYNDWAAFANFFGNVFNDPIASIIHLFGAMADKVLGILESIAKAIDSIFGSNLSGAVSGWRSGLSAKVETLASKMGNGSYEKKVEGINLTSESLGLKRISYGEAWNKGYSKGKGASDAAGNLKNSIQKALDTSNLGDTTGTDKSGGKAVKTTTNDDLFSDEDMQLLLDVATRDYKLNYQQITPNVTVTFGDVRETADVDSILDEVATKLEEIYDGNLEVR